MKEGDIILTPLPQANGELKTRPAVILREMPRYRDLLVCGISTKLHQFEKTLDEIISPIDDDFKLSGLRSKSLIRAGFLAVLARKHVFGSIGSISNERHKRILKRLSNYIALAT